MEYISAALEEIALEGLVGITLSNLLLRLKHRYGSHEIIFENEHFLSYLIPKLQNKNIEFYCILPMREVENDQNEMIMKILDDIKAISPIYNSEDNLSRGFCSHKDKRVNITSCLNKYQNNNFFSIITKLNDLIIFVALQKLRYKVLCGSQFTDYAQISNEAYIALEKIGKSRESGVASMDPFWKELNYDNKKLFYLVKFYLLKNKLVTKTKSHLQTSPECSNFYLARYAKFESKYCKILSTVTEYLNLLISKSSFQRDICVRFKIKPSLMRYILKYSSDYLVARKTKSFNMSVMVRLHLVKVFDDQCPNPFEWPPVPTSGMKNELDDYEGLDNDSITNTTVVADDNSIYDNEENKSVFNEDQATPNSTLFSPYHLTPKIPILAQAYNLIELSNPTGGLKAEEIRYYLNLDRLETRYILNALSKWSITYSVNKSIGRQNVRYYLVSKSSKSYPMALDFCKTKQGIVEGCGPNVEDVINKITKTSQPTTLMLDRLKFILNYVTEKRVLCNYYGLYKALRDREAQTGSIYTICRKTLPKLIDRLIMLKTLRIIKVSINSDKPVEAALITLPDIPLGDPMIQKYIELLKLKFKYKSKKTRNPPNCDKFDDPNWHLNDNGRATGEAVTFNCDTDDTLLMSSVRTSLFRSTESELMAQQVDLSLSLLPNIGKAYGYLPKMERCSILHKFLIYINGLELINDDDGGIRLSTIPLSEPTVPTVYRDSSFPDWQRYIPFVKENINYSGWLTFSTILENMPLSMFLQIVNMPWEVKGLQTWLENHRKRHYLMAHVPVDIRKLLLYRNIHVVAFKKVFELLMLMGLIAINKTFQAHDKMSIRVNPCATLKDTRISLPGKNRIRHPFLYDRSMGQDDLSVDPLFPKKHFKFDHLGVVDAYWDEMRDWTLKTPLHMRSNFNPSDGNVPRVLNCQRDELVSSLRHRFVKNHILYGIINEPRSDIAPQDQTICPICKYNVPGDGLGASGFDSSLNIHYPRNWIKPYNDSGNRDVKRSKRTADSSSSLTRGSKRSSFGLRANGFHTTNDSTSENKLTTATKRKRLKRSRIRDMLEVDPVTIDFPPSQYTETSPECLGLLSDCDRLTDLVLQFGCGLEIFFSLYIHERKRSRNISTKLLTPDLVLNVLNTVTSGTRAERTGWLSNFSLKYKHIARVRRSYTNHYRFHKFLTCFLVTLPNVERSFKGVQGQVQMEKVYQRILVWLLRIFLPLRVPRPSTPLGMMDKFPVETITYDAFLDSISFFEELNSIDRIGCRNPNKSEVRTSSNTVSHQFYASLLVSRTLWVTLGYRNVRSYNTPLWRMRPLENLINSRILTSAADLLSEIGIIQGMKTYNRELIQKYYRSVLIPYSQPRDNDDQTFDDEPFWTYKEGLKAPLTNPSLVSSRDFRYEAGPTLRNLFFQLPQNNHQYFVPLHNVLQNFRSEEHSVPNIRRDGDDPFLVVRNASCSLGSAGAPDHAKRLPESILEYQDHPDNYELWPDFNVHYVTSAHDLAPPAVIYSSSKTNYHGHHFDDRGATTKLLDMLLNNFYQGPEYARPFFTSLTDNVFTYDPTAVSINSMGSAGGSLGIADRIKCMKRRPYTFKYEMAAFLGQIVHPIPSSESSGGSSHDSCYDFYFADTRYGRTVDGNKGVRTEREATREVDQRNPGVLLLGDLPPPNPLRRMLQLSGIGADSEQEIDTLVRSYNNPNFEQVFFVPFDVDIRWKGYQENLGLDEKVASLVPLLGFVTEPFDYSSLILDEMEEKVCNLLFEEITKAEYNGISEKDVYDKFKAITAITKGKSVNRYIDILLRANRIFIVGTTDITYMAHPFMRPWSIEIALNTSSFLPPLKKLASFLAIPSFVRAHFFRQSNENVAQDCMEYGSTMSSTRGDSTLDQMDLSSSIRDFNNSCLENYESRDILSISRVMAYPWHDIEALLKPVRYSNIVQHHRDSGGKITPSKSYNFYLIYLFASTTLDMVINNPGITETNLLSKCSPVLSSAHLRIILNFLRHTKLLSLKIVATSQSDGKSRSLLFRPRPRVTLETVASSFPDPANRIYFSQNPTYAAVRLKDFFGDIGLVIKYDDYKSDVFQFV